MKLEHQGFGENGNTKFRDSVDHHEEIEQNSHYFGISHLSNHSWFDSRVAQEDYYHGEVEIKLLGPVGNLELNYENE